ncbi:MAG: hypothetical protein E5V21_02510 [Mesorhizobium sp.]|nr:MAG: hypothetical protein E5V21_02510 [Mesorhizobium sp.]
MRIQYCINAGFFSMRRRANFSPVQGRIISRVDQSGIFGRSEPLKNLLPEVYGGGVILTG